MFDKQIKEALADKVYAVEDEDIISIIYHTPQGEGDRHYVDVIYKTGERIRIFNIQKIVFY